MGCWPRGNKYVLHSVYRTPYLTESNLKAPYKDVDLFKCSLQAVYKINAFDRLCVIIT